MINPKQYITDLAEICYQKGIVYVVISPGSRNAPLTQAFFKKFGNDCFSIVDERCAGYYALGLAIYSGKPTVIICTSGTAVLNLAPAIAEAHYQKIPLLAITADRPVEWINQNDNQTLLQNGVFGKNCKASYQLPQNCNSTNDLWYSNRIANEAINSCLNENKGPVHINVPLLEPLYEELPIASSFNLAIEQVMQLPPVNLHENIVYDWLTKNNILIIHGQSQPDTNLLNAFRELAKEPNVVILAENIANLKDSSHINCPDLFFGQNRSEKIPPPDLVIYSGGQVVSKLLKAYLSKLAKVEIWRIGSEDNIVDTYQHITKHIQFSERDFYPLLSNYKRNLPNPSYKNYWLKAYHNALKNGGNIINDSPFCDLKIFSIINDNLPQHTLVHLGNSSVIRYSQLTPSKNGVDYFSNRGVSGIDGALSTSSGIATASERVTLSIVGDLSFIYDSNALWNSKLSAKLKIIVINNKGGGIFSLIDGPKNNPEFEKFFVTHHPVNIKKLTDAYGINYLSATNSDELVIGLENLFASQSCTLLEVHSNEENNTPSFHKMMGKLN